MHTHTHTRTLDQYLAPPWLCVLCNDHVVAIKLLVADECIEFFNISYHCALSVGSSDIQTLMTCSLAMNGTGLN